MFSGIQDTWGNKMTQTVRFVDTVSYTEADQSDFNMRMMRPQGVIPESTLGTLIPSAIASMNVRIGPGEAFIQGFQYKNDANVDVAIGANSSGSTRIDIVILKLDRTANTLILTVKAGTPGAGAPALTQVAGGTWEFPIANITVANGASSIVTGNISDQRVFSKWPSTALDTSGITAQITALQLMAPKAYGKLQGNGGGVTLLSGQGISSVTRSGPGSYRINWSTAFLNADYTVVCQGITTHGGYVLNVTQTTTYTDVILFAPGTGFEDGYVHIAAFGAQ